MENKNQNKRKKEETRGERIGIIQKIKEAHLRTGTNKVLRMGVVPGREWGFKALGMAPTQRELLRRQLASAARRKPSVSLSLFPETNSLEIEHEFACASSLDGAMERLYKRSREKTSVGSHFVDESQMNSRRSLL